MVGRATNIAPQIAWNRLLPDPDQKGPILPLNSPPLAQDAPTTLPNHGGSQKFKGIDQTDAEPDPWESPES